MRAVLALATLVAAFVVFAPSAAADAPPGQGLIVEEGVFTCNGSSQPVVIHPSGSTGWVDGRHIVILSFTFATPDGTFTKTSGNKTGLSVAYTCVGQDGPVTLTFVAALVPPS